MRNVCVFLGSRTGNDPSHAEQTKKLGELMAQMQMRLVYGGGRVGLMGLLADSVLAAGGEVTGVIPQFLFSKEVAHTGLTDLIEVSSMHERKALMENLSSAFIALPGGFGTMDELCEIITWSQIGIHSKPIGLLNVNGFFDPFIEFIKLSCQKGFIPNEHFDQLIIEGSAQALLNRF